MIKEGRGCDLPVELWRILREIAHHQASAHRTAEEAVHAIGGR